LDFGNDLTVLLVLLLHNALYYAFILHFDKQKFDIVVRKQTYYGTVY
jgi:hypothetical protein